MVKTKGKPKTLLLRSDEQRRAIASPLRLELIGLFIEREALSVAQIAQRMGRPATAIHYHVRLLEKAGLLRRAGERRSGSRSEALYRPVAEVFEMELPGDTTSGDPEAAIKTLSMAFRMAVGDMKGAFEDSSVRSSGPKGSVNNNIYNTVICWYPWFLCGTIRGWQQIVRCRLRSGIG